MPVGTMVFRLLQALRSDLAPVLCYKMNLLAILSFFWGLMLALLELTYVESFLDVAAVGGLSSPFFNTLSTERPIPYPVVLLLDSYGTRNLSLDMILYSSLYGFTAV